MRSCVPHGLPDGDDFPFWVFGGIPERDVNRGFGGAVQVQRVRPKHPVRAKHLVFLQGFTGADEVA